MNSQRLAVFVLVTLAATCGVSQADFSWTANGPTGLGTTDASTLHVYGYAGYEQAGTYVWDNTIPISSTQDNALGYTINNPWTSNATGITCEMITGSATGGSGTYTYKARTLPWNASAPACMSVGICSTFRAPTASIT